VASGGAGWVRAVGGKGRLIFLYSLHGETVGLLDDRRVTSNKQVFRLATAQSKKEVANPSDNLKNLFEIPVLFYALVLYLFVTNQVDAVYVNAAWVFVVFRALHSAVHCTFNLIMLRFYLYLFATLAVWFIAIRAALIHFGA
jgi:hypothetical protein